MLAANMLSQQGFGVWFESHGFVSWLFLGLIAGWLAGKIARGRSFGCLTEEAITIVFEAKASVTFPTAASLFHPLD